MNRLLSLIVMVSVLVLLSSLSAPAAGQDKDKDAALPIAKEKWDLKRWREEKWFQLQEMKYDGKKKTVEWKCQFTQNVTGIYKQTFEFSFFDFYEGKTRLATARPQALDKGAFTGKKGDAFVVRLKLPDVDLQKITQVTLRFPYK
jgi:hypothetical protein